MNDGVAVSGTTVSGLTVEHRTDPLGVDAEPAEVRVAHDVRRAWPASVGVPHPGRLLTRAPCRRPGRRLGQRSRRLGGLGRDPLRGPRAPRLDPLPLDGDGVGTSAGEPPSPPPTSRPASSAPTASPAGTARDGSAWPASGRTAQARPSCVVGPH
ncbi:hypothetical protein ACRAWF_39420 [Streptomyces sp. L7]